MARSAKQRASRNLKRRSSPVFEFTKLPAELQLLVICKCDVITMGKLLKVSSYAKSLCPRYPETIIQAALEEIPKPIAGLLHVASVLENISEENFDNCEILEMLNQVSLAEWPVKYPQYFSSKIAAPGRVLSLANICAEAGVATNIVTQGMNAAMEAYIDPWVVVEPIVLSITEEMRMVGALVLVRIYYQLRPKFEDGSYTRGRNFAAAFMGGLAPWQMAQGMAIEEFFDSCIQDPHGFFHEIIDKRYTCYECLSQESSYLRDYNKTAIVDIETGYT